MNIYKKLTIFAAASVTAVSGVAAFAGSAAATPGPDIRFHTASSSETPPASLIGPKGEKPKEWGYAVIPADAPVGPGRQGRVNVGGGTWYYGSEAATPWKKCYSNYVHPTQEHSATTVMGSETKKLFNRPGLWANTWITGGWGHECKAYWGKY